jgi:hypothetical protein
MGSFLLCTQHFAQILKHQHRDLFTIDDFTGLSNMDEGL